MGFENVQHVLIGGYKSEMFFLRYHRNHEEKQQKDTTSENFFQTYVLPGRSVPFFPFLNWTSATFLLEVLEFAFRVCWVNHGRVKIPLRIW